MQSMPITLNTLALFDMGSIAVAVTAVARATIVLNLDEAQMHAMFDTSVYGKVYGQSGESERGQLLAYAQGLYNGHWQRILEDHCEEVYRKTERKGAVTVEHGYQWRSTGSQGPLMFTAWQRVEGLEAFL